MKKRPIVSLIIICVVICILTIQTRSIYDTFRSTEIEYISAEKDKLVVDENGSITEFEEEMLEEANEEDEKQNQWIVELTQDELESFYKLVFAEDGIENEDKQVAVAATYLNRMLSEKFPNEFYDVLNQKNAFSSVKNGKIYLMTENPCEVTLEMVPEETKNAVHRALDGEDPTEELLRKEAYRLGVNEEEYAKEGALYFYNPDACGPEALSKRESILVKSRMGYHFFYKVWG